MSQPVGADSDIAIPPHVVLLLLPLILTSVRGLLPSPLAVPIK
jgi:hypothetical protein